MLGRSISKRGAAAPQATTRQYRSQLRKQQAEQTRRQVVAAAAELFADEGYARTTLAKVAAAAGVSVETVQTHGPKAALMVAAVEQAAFEKTGDTDILDTEMGRRFLAIQDRDEALDYLASAQTELHQRSARTTKALFDGAAADAELDRYLDDLIAGVGRQVRRIVLVCREREWLRDDRPVDEVVETAAVICGVEVYLRMVQRDGWTVSAYRAWLRRMIAEVLFCRPSSVTAKASTSAK